MGMTVTMEENPVILEVQRSHIVKVALSKAQKQTKIQSAKPVNVGYL